MNLRFWVFVLVVMTFGIALSDSPMGIVILCENGGSLGPDEANMEVIFELNREGVQALLADIFGIESSEMDGMTLTEIVDTYGEAWQLEEMRARCEGYYQRIITLSDENCTPIDMFDSLVVLKDEGLIIDLVFVLHGSTTHVVFDDRDFWIENLTMMMEYYEIPLRALYQTCCWGSHMIADWEDYGITAVNGSYQVNYFPLFAPIFFLEAWTSGETFEDAVQMALQAELDTLAVYAETMPFLSFFLTPANIASSRQIIGGSIPNLYWEDFYSSPVVENIPSSMPPEITVFPNPSFGGEIAVESDSPISEISLYDITGRQIISRYFHAESTVNLDIGGLKTGSYIVKTNTEGDIQTQKLFVY